jgi:hypothetical protein
MTATCKTTKTGKLSSKRAAIVSYRMAPAGFGQYVLVATLSCGHSVDTKLTAEAVTVGVTTTRCIACGQA